MWEPACLGGRRRQAAHPGVLELQLRQLHEILAEGGGALGPEIQEL